MLNKYASIMLTGRNPVKNKLVTTSGIFDGFKKGMLFFNEYENMILLHLRFMGSSI